MNMPNLNELIEAAIKEDWELVDTEIPLICNNSQIIEWALDEGLNADSGNVRDLAASILEKAKIPSDNFERMRKIIGESMISEEHPYAKFRDACVLAAHGPGEYKEGVKGVLNKALEDPDISKIAKRYLKKV